MHMRNTHSNSVSLNGSAPSSPCSPMSMRKLGVVQNEPKTQIVSNVEPLRRNWEAGAVALFIAAVWLGTSALVQGLWRIHIPLWLDVRVMSTCGVVFSLWLLSKFLRPGSQRMNR